MARDRQRAQRSSPRFQGEPHHRPAFYCAKPGRAGSRVAWLTAEGLAVNRVSANGPCQVTGDVNRMKQVLALSHVRKAYEGKIVLDDVTLGFLPGAKIGVVGPNGMGKSTLLTMMAGLEQPSNGEVLRIPGFSVGLLSQEPALDDGKTVLGNVAEGVAETKALLDRYNEIATRLAAGDSDGLLDEMDRLRCPPPDAAAKDLSGGERRRVALCLLLLSQ